MLHWLHVAAAAAAGTAFGTVLSRWYCCTTSQVHCEMSCTNWAGLQPIIAHVQLCVFHCQPACACCCNASQVLLPYSQGALLDELHKMGKVLNTAYTEAGTLLSASVPRCLVGKLVQYAAADSSSSISSSGSSSGWGGSSGSAELGGQGDGDGCEGEEEGLEGVQLIEEAVEGRQGSGLVLSRSSSNSSSMSSM